MIVLMTYFWESLCVRACARAGASSRFKAETEMTGEDTAGNYILFLKMCLWYRRKKTA